MYLVVLGRNFEDGVPSLDCIHDKHNIYVISHTQHGFLHLLLHGELLYAVESDGKGERKGGLGEESMPQHTLVPSLSCRYSKAQKEGCGPRESGNVAYSLVKVISVVKEY